MNTETIKVLLIEDNDGDATLIGEYLRNASGYRFKVILATSPTEVIGNLSTDRIDIVLADMGLPDNQGLDTLDQIMTTVPDIPVIFITGFSDVAMGLESVKKGAQDYLVKDQLDEMILVRTIIHAIERKQTDNQKRLTNRILSILNRQNVWEKLLRDILTEIKMFTGIEAVGIRLKQGQDYPYFESNGFQDLFLKSDSFLCSRDKEGAIHLDKDGSPVLDCMCGNIIRERFDPAQPFYTGVGSFWTNSSTQLNVGSAQNDRVAFTRNHCIEDGYESLALIPLHSGEMVIGLLQLCDHRKNMLTLRMIRFLEEIGATLGIAFTRMESERKTNQRIKELNVMHNIAIIAEISSTMEDFSEGILELVPLGFSDVERTFCKLEIERIQYQGRNFDLCTHHYGSDIRYNNKKVGRIEVGVMDAVDQPGSLMFLQEEKEMIITISKQIGDYVGRKRSDQIQKVIYEISTFTNTSSSLEELVMLIQKQLSTLIDTTNFYIAMYDESMDFISIPYYADQKDTITSFPAGKTLTAYVIRTKKAFLGKRDDLDQLAASGRIETIGEKAKVWLGIPLLIKGNVIGVFAVQSYSDENAYGSGDLEMLEVISQQISISIERKRADQELIQALEQAMESDRLKSAFLATMSHELRTPLNAVIGFSQLIDAETSIDDILDFVQHINKGGHHLLEIINDILNISVIESGKAEVKKENLYLRTIMEDIDKLVREEQRKVHKEHIHILSSAPEDGHDHWVDTDIEKLGQILMSLLNNALKFTIEGTIEFGYAVKSYNNDTFLEFFVKDTGIGMPTDIQEIIFDIFRQADESHTRTHGGTGLGLSIAKKMTELLGGAIRVESEEGRGSTFYFTIPYKGEIPGKEHKLPAEPAVVLNCKGKTVLVAEDEDSNYDLLEIYLEGIGVSVIWAKNGQEAVEKCSERPEIDLVLMDLKMPVMNGFDATRLIRETRPNLPVIAQTAYAMTKDREEAISSGCIDLITKPIRKIVFLEMVSKYMPQS